MSADSSDQVFDGITCDGCDRLARESTAKPEKYTDRNDFSDVTMLVDGKELYLHSQVLANRSPVFASLYLDPMNRSRQIELEGKKLEHVVEFLDCLYSFDAVIVNGQNAIPLLELAQEFDVSFLQTICIDILCVEAELCKGMHSENCQKRADADVEYKLTCLMVAWTYSIERLYIKTIKLLSHYRLSQLELHQTYKDMDQKLARLLMEERIRYLEPLTERQERNQENAEQELCRLYEIVLGTEKYAKKIVNDLPTVLTKCSCNESECMYCSTMSLARAMLRACSQEMREATNNTSAMSGARRGSTAPMAFGSSAAFSKSVMVPRLREKFRSAIYRHPSIVEEGRDGGGGGGDHGRELSPGKTGAVPGALNVAVADLKTDNFKATGNFMGGESVAIPCSIKFGRKPQQKTEMQQQQETTTTQVIRSSNSAAKMVTTKRRSYQRLLLDHDQDYY